MYCSRFDHCTKKEKVQIAYENTLGSLRGCCFLSLDFDIVHTVFQDDVDEFVAGIVGFSGNFIQLFQQFVPDANGDDTMSVLTTLFNFQWRLIASAHIQPSFHSYYYHSLTLEGFVYYN